MAELRVIIASMQSATRSRSERPPRLRRAFARGVGRAVAGALALGAALGGGPAAAHPLAPSLLDVRLAQDGTASVLFKTPSMRPTGTSIEPFLPPHCRELAPPAAREEGTAVVFETRVDCGGQGLVGHEVGFRGLAESGTNALLRVELPGGQVVRTVLHGGQPRLSVPAEPGWVETARDYLGLGFGHILSGIDHLLFVAGLLLLVSGARMLVETVTAFTIGHSLTLSAAALGWARVPSGPVEIAIAASILWLAVEVANRQAGAGTPAWRRPRSMAGGFGLLHGFGFAGALAEIGLPQNEIPLALASFNVGIELGQLAFVAVLVAAAWAARRVRLPLPDWGRTAAAYGIGSLAAFWTFERAASLL